MGDCWTAAVEGLKKWKKIESTGGKAHYLNTVESHHVGQCGELGAQKILASLTGAEVTRPGHLSQADLRIHGVGLEVKTFRPASWQRSETAPEVQSQQLKKLGQRAKGILFMELRFLWVGLLGWTGEKHTPGTREYVADVKLRCWAEPKDFAGLVPRAVAKSGRMAGNLHLPPELRRDPDELLERLQAAARHSSSRLSETSSRAKPPSVSRIHSSATS